MPKPTWEVAITVEAEHVLTIGSNHLAGIENIDDYADTILTCAQHLVSFIGGETEREKFFREEKERAARNRDMWKGQCERQAEQLTTVHALLRDALAALEPIGAEANEWSDDVPDAYHPGVTEPGHSQAHASAKFSLGDLRRARSVSSHIKKELPDEV